MPDTPEKMLFGACLAQQRSGTWGVHEGLAEQAVAGDGQIGNQQVEQWFCQLERSLELRC